MESVFSVPLPRPAVKGEEPTWLPAAMAGEPWALEQFFHSYQPQIYSLCHRLLHRPEDAQDATQTTFVQAFRHLPRFRGRSGVKTWLYRIAVNESLTLLRRRRDTRELVPEEWVAEPGPQLVERLAVQAALQEVSPEHRTALVLRFWEGLEYEEIAEVLGISLSAAKMRVHRGRDEFRKRYEERP